MSDEVTSIAPARARINVTWEIINTIFDRIAGGESLNKITKEPDMPARKTVYAYIAGNDDVRKAYEAAIHMRADVLAEEIIDIADDGINDTYMTEDGQERTNQDVIARSKLRVDARKWYASKMNPRKYGDKVSTELTGGDGAPVNMGLNVVFKSPPKRDTSV